MSGWREWLVRHDPGLIAVRRAVRVTIVACLGFYLCRYVLDSPAMAPYALFGTIALGALSQIPGTPAQRARTLVAVLPAAWLLVTLGTLLSVSIATAVAGMAVLGFAVSFVGVGGPRLVGIASGVQLLYILPSFPPFDPGGLAGRLAGVTLAVVLLAVAELVIWPDPTPPSYTRKLGVAVGALAGCLDAVADGWSGRAGRDRLATLLPDAVAAAERIRPSQLPPIQRPASAGRRDRALTAAAGTTRLMLGRALDLSGIDEHDAVELPAAAALLSRSASCAEAAGAWLRGEDAAVPDTDVVMAALTDFRAARAATSPDGLPPDRLRLGSMALALGEWTTVLVAAVRVVAGAPIGPDPTPEPARPGPLWFAYRSSAALWWHRLREHLTPRSVAFQGALRLAAALAFARLLAGVLDLSHGFWVLLTILTVLRTSAAETRSALRPALVGTVAGSVVAAGLLVIGIPPTVYAVALPLVMLVGFAAGPLLGPGPAQALLTLVITFVFAQVAPVDWQLAEARVVDVAVGAAVGVLIGLLAWPRGGSGELSRATGTFLTDAAGVVRETVDVLTSAAPAGAALPGARRSGRLADASYALYQSEHPGPAPLDWQATLVAGHHAVRGAEALARTCPAGRLLPCVTAVRTAAEDVARRYERLGGALLLPTTDGTPPVQDAPPDLQWPTDLGQDLYHLADLHVWLDGLREDLARAVSPQRALDGPTADADGIRGRLAHLADGSTG